MRKSSTCAVAPYSTTIKECKIILKRSSTEKSGSTSYEMTPHVRLESSGGVLSTVEMVVLRRDHSDDDFRHAAGVTTNCSISTVIPSAKTLSANTSVCLSHKQIG